MGNTGLDLCHVMNVVSREIPNEFCALTEVERVSGRDPTDLEQIALRRSREVTQRCPDRVSQGLREVRNGEQGCAASSTPLGVLALFWVGWENSSIIHAEGVPVIGCWSAEWRASGATAGGDSGNNPAQRTTPGPRRSPERSKPGSE